MMVVEMKEGVAVEKVNEEDLVENKDLRKKVMDRVEVLEKVKKVFTLGKTDIIMTSMVADFYEVGIPTIHSLIHNNKEEIVSNGYKTLKGKEIIEIVLDPLIKNESTLKNSKGYYLVDEHKVPYSNTGVFTLRAMLNVGMLLRDSLIAKEVRNQLLNIFDSSTTEQKVMEIDREKEMALSVLFAKSEEEQLWAFSEYKNYKDRHIAELNVAIAEEKAKNAKQTEEINHKEEIIQSIADDISIADKRQILNRIVRKDCPASMHSQRWVYLYKEFGSKYHMNIKARTDKFNESTGNKYSTLDYVDSELGMFNELYGLAVKLFSGSVEKLANELYEIRGAKSES